MAYSWNSRVDRCAMSAHNQFFILLKAGLWQKPVDPSFFSEDTDWNCIYRIAQQQTVVGIVYEGLITLPAHLQPEQSLLRQWSVWVARIEQSHELLNSRLLEVTELLHAQDIESVLLKGQGVAQNYPIPNRRNCGDIDLYIGCKEHKKTYEVVHSWGITPRYERKDAKHYSFDFKGVSVELHFIAQHIDNPFRNRKFQRWTEYHLLNSGSLNNGSDVSVRRWSLNGTDILLPPVNFDVLYIFSHAFHHFIEGGVGFRQLCDWTLFLHRYSNEIDSEVLGKNLKSFGLTKAWNIFGAIAVEQLGLSKDKMPFYPVNAIEKCKKLSIQADKVVEYIFKDGNFGSNSIRQGRPKSYLRGKLHSFLGIQKRLLGLFRIFPKDVVADSTAHFMRGIAQIFRDKR